MLRTNTKVSQGQSFPRVRVKPRKNSVLSAPSKNDFYTAPRFVIKFVGLFYRLVRCVSYRSLHLAPEKYAGELFESL